MMQTMKVKINPRTWSKRNKVIIFGFVLVLIIVFGFWRYQASKKQTPSVQTATAELGTFVSSISGSGKITTGNNLIMTTTATGTVKYVYVKNGDIVKQGQKIAEIELDQESLQRQKAAWASYLGAKNSLAQARATVYTLQSKEFAANQAFMKGAVANNDSTADPNYIQQNADWLAAEAAYKNQAGVIEQAQAALSSSWLNYQQIASTIVAPKSGVIKNLTIAPGSVISSTTSSTNSTATQQQLGTVSDPQGKAQAVVDLSEIDAINVFPDQKVIITLDAFPDSTFTGKILTVNTNGQVNSGVTTYPVTIVFDTAPDNIYPNMAVSARIITEVQNGVILVPLSAVHSDNGESTVQVMKNGQETAVTVETGKSNDTQIIITSGIVEGDQVVTSTSINSTQTTTGTSPFSPFGNRGFGGGGGGTMIRRFD